MGGGAFTWAVAPGQPTLSTPRMTPEEYETIKTKCLTKLREHLPRVRVANLIEAPEKPDYGDVDLVIASDDVVNFRSLADVVGAAGYIHHGPRTCSLAVPKHPTTRKKLVVVYKCINTQKDGDIEPSATMTDEEYAQVDLEVIRPELFEWHMFYSSYGDMLGLLGHIMHNLGFTINDRGMWLRVPEIETARHAHNIAVKDGTIFLTVDPKKVMEFLGVSVKEYEAGFNTTDQLYSWLFRCRMLHLEAIKLKRNNAHERRREQTRKMYREFFYEWLPEHMDMSYEEGPEQVAKLKELRLRYLEEAGDFFAKREEIEAKRDALIRQMSNAVASNLLKPIVAECSGKKDKGLVELMRAFRRHVVFSAEDNPQIVEIPHTDGESQLYRFVAEDMETLKEPEARMWVQANWEKLRAVAKKAIYVHMHQVPCAREGRCD